MTRKEKIDQLRLIANASQQLSQAAYHLLISLKENLDNLVDDNNNTFAHAAAINMKLLASMLEPKGFTVKYEDPKPTIDSSFLDAAAMEATAKGQKWE